jgi:hypothetical protein
MAYGFGGMTLTLELTDAGNGVTRVTFGLDPTKNTFILAEPVASDTVLKLAPLTYCAIKRYVLTTKWVDGLVPAGGSPYARREKAAYMSLRHAVDTVKKLTHTIEGPDVGIFTAAAGVTNYNKLDTADANLAQYIAHFETTLDLINHKGEFRLSDGEAVSATTPVVKGKRITKGGYVDTTE